MEVSVDPDGWVVAVLRVRLDTGTADRVPAWVGAERGSGISRVRALVSVCVAGLSAIAISACGGSSATYADDAEAILGPLEMRLVTLSRAVNVNADRGSIAEVSEEAASDLRTAAAELEALDSTPQLDEANAALVLTLREFAGKFSALRQSALSENRREFRETVLSLPEASEKFERGLESVELRLAQAGVTLSS